MSFFQKNVYSVFKANPPSVGFAQLSTQVQSLYAAGDALPSPTIGQAATVATGVTVGGTPGAVGGAERNAMARWAVMLVAMVVGAVVGW